MKAVREEEVKLRGAGKGLGFVKQVGFKPGVKERWSYGWAEGEWEEMGEGIGELEMEELVPEWGCNHVKIKISVAWMNDFLYAEIPVIIRFISHLGTVMFYP